MEPSGNADGAIEFYQLVRMLERQLWTAREKTPQQNSRNIEDGLGDWCDYATEPIRLQPANSLANYDRAVAKVCSQPRDAENPAWIVELTFMGLIGPMGVLPTHVTAWLLGEGEAARPAMRDFFGVFEHRIISRFYRAWEQSRFVFGLERVVRQNRDETAHGFTLALRALIGFADRTLSQRLTVSQRLPTFYGGLISNLARPAENLPQIVAAIFQVPCILREFIGEWQVIPRSQQTRLGRNSVRPERDHWNSRLGITACVGSRVWTVQDRFRLQLGPLDCATFNRCTPAGDLFRHLREIVKLYAGTELVFDIQPVLRPADVPSSHLGTPPNNTTRLGWNSWLGVQPHTRPAGDAVFRSSD